MGWSIASFQGWFDAGICFKVSTFGIVFLFWTSASAGYRRLLRVRDGLTFLPALAGMTTALGK